MQMIRLKEVMAITQLCKASIYKLRKQGNFPLPVQLSQRAVGWHLQDIKDWLDSRKPVDTEGWLAKHSTMGSKKVGRKPVDTKKAA